MSNYGQSINFFIVGFGKRLHPILKTEKMHNGVDFSAALGTKVQCPADGKVIDAGEDKARGKYIKISHNEQYVTLYYHMNLISVTEGQNVQQGMKIGEVGSTGFSTAPHLHFELHKNGVAIDPTDYLPKR